MYDAIVVGLGPAGSMACYTLASRGLSVLGIDKQRHPRYKSCGGCLSTKITRLFDFDISHLYEDTVYGITFTYKYRRRLDILSDQPIAHNVMRDAFDHFLVEKARSAGAEIIEGRRVAFVADDGKGVTVTTADGAAFKARFLIGADGASGLVGRDLFGLTRRLSAVSITAEVPYALADSSGVTGREHVDYASIPNGYSWIFPKKNHVSIGVAADAVKIGGGIKRYFNELITKHPLLDGVNPGDVCGWTIPMYHTGVTKVAKGRVALAGDSGHLVDPFMGEGIYYAALTGKTVAEAVTNAIASDRGDLTQYQRWIEKDIFPEFNAGRKLSDLTYKYPQLWYSIIEKNPDVMRRFYNVIRGEETFQHFYAWAINRAKSRPLTMLLLWLKSRFLPI